MINVNKEKEEKFYANKDFCFSYSSLNKLLFSPSLFYKDYILWDREVRTDKHLIEGKLIHCLLFEEDKVEEKPEIEEIAEKVNEDIEAELRRAFEALDLNHDGVLDHNEIKQMLLGAGDAEITDDDANKLIEEADINGDGMIDLEEFLAMTRKK